MGNFLANNWGLIVTGIFLILGVVLGGRRLLWFQWFNEVANYAWHRAEVMGLTENWSGAQKFAYYFNLWQDEYRKKYLKEPDVNAFEAFRDKATELSIKEKVIALASPK